jgi:hypothetical protein
MKQKVLRTFCPADRSGAFKRDARPVNRRAKAETGGD